ncbi:MAG TPA: transposase [Myxococcales bacterium]|nr:transposase [Myxococcales bacterium]HIK85521.1 transposase [Myxococcales bacterium]
MSGGLRHPFGGALYTCTSEGKIKLEDEGRSGLFHSDGRWIEGELREADPQFCGWVAGDRVVRRGMEEVESD